MCVQSTRRIYSYLEFYFIALNQFVKDLNEKKFSFKWRKTCILEYKHSQWCQLQRANAKIKLLNWTFIISCVYVKLTTFGSGTGVVFASCVWCEYCIRFDLLFLNTCILLYWFIRIVVWTVYFSKFETKLAEKAYLLFL